MRRSIKIIAAIVLTGAAAVVAAAPADACACGPRYWKTCSEWTVDADSYPGNETLYVSKTTRHTSCRSARAVGDVWLDDNAWAPTTLSAAGKTWHRFRHSHGDDYRLAFYRSWTSTGKPLQVGLSWYDR